VQGGEESRGVHGRVRIGRVNRRDSLVPVQSLLAAVFTDSRSGRARYVKRLRARCCGLKALMTDDLPRGG